MNLLIWIYFAKAYDSVSLTDYQHVQESCRFREWLRQSNLGRWIIPIEVFGQLLESSVLNVNFYVTYSRNPLLSINNIPRSPVAINLLYLRRTTMIRLKFTLLILQSFFLFFVRKWAIILATRWQKFGSFANAYTELLAACYKRIQNTRNRWSTSWNILIRR